MAPPLPSREDLGRRLLASLDIAKRSIPVLATARQAGDGQRPFKREKFICETGFLLYAAWTAAEELPPLRAQVAALAADLLPHARSEALLLTMRLRPALAPELSAAHACLSKIGFPDPGFQAELDSILAAPQSGRLERVPWKDIEHDWLTRAGNRPRRRAEAELALERTTLTCGLDALAARREEVYAFTHGLIYLTDFGRSPRRLPRSVGALVDDAEAALARCLDDDDFDLGGEVLLTWPYLRADWTPAASFAALALFRVEDEVGFLPSLSLRQRDLEELDDGEKSLYVMAEAYHTAYVMGLLCAALLLPGDAPRSVESTEAYPGGSDALRSLMPARDPNPQWESLFASLPKEHCDRLAPFLAAVGLRRAVMHGDYQSLRSILAICLEFRLPISPTVQQAGELLERLVGHERFLSRSV